MSPHYFEIDGGLCNSQLVGELEYLRRAEWADSTGRHVPENDKRTEATAKIKTALEAGARDLAYSNYSAIDGQCGKAWVEFCQETYGDLRKMELGDAAKSVKKVEDPTSGSQSPMHPTVCLKCEPRLRDGRQMYNCSATNSDLATRLSEASGLFCSFQYIVVLYCRVRSRSNNYRLGGRRNCVSIPFTATQGVR